ncbi:hypothetical protein AC244_07045 [Ensifer adhaerens]|uniref:Uncharacterized protein n=1 Tax=Ensifer adhaerens TaxID=106592 RepID=A0A0L8C2W5_ENSAD|nr:hypothetical protein AC244_07045 [Ensifer adhaerens]
MRHAGRNVEHLAGAHDDVLLESLAEPGMRFPRQQIDRRLMALVQMRLGTGAGQMHADARRADGFRGDALEIAEPLPSGASTAGPNHATARIG